MGRRTRWQGFILNFLVADLAGKGDQTLQGWSLVSEAEVVCPLKKKIVLHVDFTLWILLMREAGAESRY